MSAIDVKAHDGAGHPHLGSDPDLEVEPGEPAELPPAPEPTPAVQETAVERHPSSPRRPNPELEPTPHDLRISIRLLIHIGRQGRFSEEDTPPESLTQSGMAKALGVSQGAVSNSLGRLVSGGVLTAERGHVRQRMIRLKVYRLTARGEDLSRRLRQRFPP